MTEDEFFSLLHFISAKYTRILGIASLGAYYGLRRSEILGLKWSAFDLDKKTISIIHTVVRVRTTKATKEFGCPEISLHKLRHNCASMLINKGWDIKELQYWLGHTDTQTTLNIYAHFNRQRLNASENDLSEISLASAGLFA